MTIFGVNLGEPQPYTVYPFFNSSVHKDYLRAANVKAIRFFLKAETLNNLEYVVNSILSFGAKPIVVTGTTEALTVAQKVGDKVIYQIGNEPNINPERYGSGGKEGYAQFYKQLTGQIKAIVPNAKFMVAGMTIGEHWKDYLKDRPEKHLDWITAVIDSGAQVDYVDFHHYGLNPGTENLSMNYAMSQADNYAEIVDYLISNTGKQVCCTEWNFGQWDAPRYDLIYNFIHYWTLTAMQGMSKTYYSLMWFAQHWSNDHVLTMFKPNSEPKFMYNAFKSVAEGSPAPPEPTPTPEPPQTEYISKELVLAAFAAAIAVLEGKK